MFMLRHEDSEKQREMWKWGVADEEIITRGKEVEKQLKSVKGTDESAHRKGTTFEVANVSPCHEPLPLATHAQSTTSRIKKGIESCFHTDVNIVKNGTLHALLKAVHLAYDRHYPLVLSPDMIWLCITQGLGIHINQNSDQLRSKFVTFSGKKEITVRRDDFVKGLATNPWPEVFDEFSQKIKDEIGEKNYELITPNFSTTGPMEKAVGDIALMDAMQSFLNYGFMTECGIPSITLEGTREDWMAIREKAIQLEQYDLKWWTDELLPILDQFVNAASGSVDKNFWSSIYKYSGIARNEYLDKWSAQRVFFGVTTDCFTSGLSRAPYVWEYMEKPFKMQFMGGFMAVSQIKRHLL
ncbi:uncharacterized protein [Ptychodera flava]|uniref:uncharacterized protein isoform X1 n=1 Tax=Ptychodera flava TaxID=63121 RepID=UPI00396A9F82